MKFFEKERQGNNIQYSNPASGFVICDHVTDSNIFEFSWNHKSLVKVLQLLQIIMQPMEIWDLKDRFQNLHMDYASFINWQGPARVPSPLKLAEKLSKMTAKFTQQQLAKSLEDKICSI